MTRITAPCDACHIPISGRQPMLALVSMLTRPWRLKFDRRKEEVRDETSRL